MNKLFNKNKSKELILYNNIVFLSRNKLFYTKFNLADTFQNRIFLIFFHISFIFNKLYEIKKMINYKNFDQNLFDLLFKQIEANMRELGYGDVTVNKKMKLLVKSFYNILLFCKDFDNKKKEAKAAFLGQYLQSNNNKQMPTNLQLFIL